ncbi:MAG: hypothetical protein HY744_25540 [Deltaproteobacteria bacterium]|nr:hypothetical protein [Deltaproteobacteria bacterium]
MTATNEACPTKHAVVSIIAALALASCTPGDARDAAAGIVTQSSLAGLRYELGVGAARVLPDTAEPAWRLELELAHLGRPGLLRPVPAARPDLRAEGQRARWRRGEDLDEWYTSGPLGLEQGFDLHRPPAGEDEVLIEVAVRGLAAEGAPGGQHVRLVDRSGEQRLAYGKLAARDASGRLLRSWITANGGVIALHVDDRGARYPVVVDPLVWTEQPTLTADKPLAGSRFGSSVSIDGDIAVVGAPEQDGRWIGDGAGAAYVFVLNKAGWGQEDKLFAGNANLADLFGSAVAIDGDTIVVGAPDHEPPGEELWFNSGAAYVFERSGAEWTNVQELTAADAHWNDGFGGSVAIDGDTVVVGASGVCNAGLEQAGAAYVFERSGGKWTEQEQQMLFASDPGAGTYFGLSVGVAGSTIVVAAPWANGVYVFAGAGGNWVEKKKLKTFGGVWSVAFDGDAIVAGAPGAGAAYVFERSDGEWATPKKLNPADASGEFGRSVSISDNTIVVGAPAPYCGTLSSAHVYVRGMLGWTETQTLAPSLATSNDGFGESVSVSKAFALIGAPGWGMDDCSLRPGTAHPRGRCGPVPAR